MNKSTDLFHDGNNLVDRSLLVGLDSLGDLGGDVGEHLLLHLGLDAVHHRTHHLQGVLHHGADLVVGGLHVGAGHLGHLSVGGAHQREGHRLVHHLHVFHGGDDASGDVVNLNGSHC